MTPSFDLIQQQLIANLNLTLEIYHHRNTGAKHIHLASDDNNNVFLVGFLTVPQDSTGVAHILEHTSLCGSRAYPMRDPFFMMIRRSLNTFMNAFTSSDWTAYPFASQNKKDFNNLLSIYLDVTFFPRLDELDFAQEGHRLEFTTPDDSNSPLTYKGVVYNEMKGAMSSTTRRLMHAMQAHVFPTITYHHNSGGEPSDIPNLTHAQLKDFHASHYHPTHAVFMTYGDIPAREHQIQFENKVLQHFSPANKTVSIANEQRYLAPQRFHAFYPLETHGDERKLEHKTHVVLGWLWGLSQDPYEKFKAILLANVLLDNSASPLRYALEQTDLGKNPSPLCFVETESHEISFYCGLEGCQAENAEKIEAFILETLQGIARDGVAYALLEAVLHQLELAQREISGTRIPYGLQWLLNLLSPSLYGADLLPLLDIDPILARLRQDIQQPDFIKQLIEKKLLNNPHRVLGVMQPDAQLAQREAQAEQEKLLHIQQHLSEADKQRIVQQSLALQQRQQTKDDPELLPKVTLRDVKDDLHIVQGTSSLLADMPIAWYAQGTNGMVYQTLVLDMPPLSDDLLVLMPLYCDYLNEVGVGERDYLQTQQWQSAISGGIYAAYQIDSGVNDPQTSRLRFTLSTKALARHQEQMTALLHQTFTQPRFDEEAHLRDLVKRTRVKTERSIDSRAMALAQSAALSGVNVTHALSDHLTGFAAISRIKELDDSLNDPATVKAFAEKLQQIQQALLEMPRRLLVISEASQQTQLADSIAPHWRKTAQGQQTTLYQPALTLTAKQQIWQGNVQVNFNVKAYAAPAYTHADAPALTVLGNFLRNGFLHTEIREKGGAYGSGANYSNGSFVFSSYRDPCLSETLATFDNALNWLEKTEHSAQALEEAILGVMQKIDQPSSPAGEARAAFFHALQGYSPEIRRAFRQQVLNVTLADLQRAAKTWLQAEKAHTVAFSFKPKAAQEAKKLGLHLCQVE